MSDNDFTRVKFPKIEGINGLIAYAVLVEDKAIEFMNYFKQLHGDFTIAEILAALPVENGDDPGECFKEIYKSLVVVLAVVNPGYETTAWEDLT